jgi:hypothetical protein
MDKLYNFFTTDSFKIISAIVSYFLLYYISRYLYRLYKRRPRAFWYNNYLDIAGKYDKSTGLDMELADKLSAALASYIVVPAKLHGDIRENPRYSAYWSYIDKHLFANYNSYNNLYTGLRLFIQYADSIYDKEKYLEPFYKKIGGKAIDTSFKNAAVLQFISALSAEKAIGVHDKLRMNIDDITAYFTSILKTQAEDSEIVLRNIFYRNVIHVIIYDSTNIINDQLKKLDNKNVISYIDPYIRKNTDNISAGKYLYMLDDNNKLRSMYDIFAINSLYPIKGANTVAAIKAAIDMDIYRYFAENSPGYTDDTNIIAYMNKWNGYKLLFDMLQNMDGTRDYRKMFATYRGELEKNKGKIYDADNIIVNELYGFKPVSGKAKVDKNTMGPFNIAGLKKEDAAIIRIFNYIIAFDAFHKSMANQKYDDIMRYYYIIEEFTVAELFNKKDGEFVRVIKNGDESLHYFRNILRLSLIRRDIDAINVGTFISLMYDTPEKILEIPKYHISLVEIKLAQNYINDVMNYRKMRTDYNIIEDYFGQLKAQYLPIFQNEWRVNWSWKNQIAITESYWIPLRNFVFNKCYFLGFDPEFAKRLGLNCPVMPDNENIAKQAVVEKFSIGRFFKRTIGTIINIGKFIIMLMDILIKLVGLIGYVASHPEKIFTFLILIVLAAIWIILVVIVYLFNISLGGGFRIGYITIMPTITWPIMALGSLMRMSMYIAIVSVYLILGGIAYIADKVLESSGSKSSTFSRGLYRWVFSCENSPWAWYKNSRYDLENKNVRGFYCKLSCGTNYRLSESGNFCEKAPNNVPYYCPQPLLYKSYIRDKISGLKVIGNMAGISGDKDFIENYKRNKREYYESCSKNNSGEKDAIARNICAYGHDNKGNDISSEIAEVCKQTYCSNGRYAEFCAKYENKREGILTGIMGGNNSAIIAAKWALIVAIMIGASITIAEYYDNGSLRMSD